MLVNYTDLKEQMQKQRKHAATAKELGMESFTLHIFFSFIYNECIASMGLLFLLFWLGSIFERICRVCDDAYLPIDMSHHIMAILASHSPAQ